MHKEQNVQPWTVPTFSKLLDYQTDADPKHEAAITAAQQSLTGASPADFAVLRGDDISLGVLIAALLLGRAIHTAKVDMFTPKAITVLRSGLNQDYLRRAIRVFAPPHMYVRTDWYRSGDPGAGVNLRELGKSSRRKLDETELTQLISTAEPMIFSGDETGDQEEFLPNYPRHTLTLMPIDAEIIRLVFGFEYPNMKAEDFDATLEAIDLAVTNGEIRPFDLACACRAADGTGALDYLHNCLARPADATPTDGSTSVAKAVAPLDDLVGYGEAKELAQDVVSALRDWQRGLIEWHDVPRGLLVIGAPGTGKTELARAMASTAGIGFVSGSYAEWQKEGHLGDFLKAMSKCFEDARNKAPCILFIDELDSFCQGGAGSCDRSGSTYELKAMKGLLEQLDGIKGREGVAIVAAANHLEDVPPVVRRSGRFDSVVEIGLPTRGDLEVILMQHLQTGEEAIDVATCAVHALGRTGADCAAALRKARAIARRARLVLRTEDVVRALSGGLRDLPEALVERMAVHECGHALVAAAYPDLQVYFLRLPAQGGECQTSGGDRVHTAATMHRDRAILLAGRVAETLVFGAPSAGAGGNEASDLAKATVSAANEVGAYGLGDSGPIWLGPGSSLQVLEETRQGNLHESPV